MQFDGDSTDQWKFNQWKCVFFVTRNLGTEQGILTA